MLKPTSSPADCDNLIVAAFGNFATAIDRLRSAQNVDQSAHDREVFREQAVAELNCLNAHFGGALDLIPAE